MPIYEFQCKKCFKNFEMILPITEYSAAQVCPECGNPAKRLVSLSDFILKGDGWYGKAQRIKGQMKKKNEKILERQKDRYHGTQPSIQPNVGGKPVDSWSDAQQIAKEQGNLAETYQPLVDKEKRGDS